MPRGLLLPLIVIALLGAVLPALAQKKPESTRELKIHADRMDYDETRKQVRLVGHVRIESGDTVMTAPYAQYHTEQLVAEFQGGVRVAQPGSTLVGNRMKVWYGEERALLSGNVRMLTERSPGGDRRTPAVMTCQELEYAWVRGIGEARGQVKVRQGNRRAFSDQAHYDRTAQTIDLIGNVRFEQGQDDWLTSQSARIHLETETIVASGQVVGRFLIEQSVKTPTSEADSTLPVPDVLEPEIPFVPAEAVPAPGLPGLED